MSGSNVKYVLLKATGADSACSKKAGFGKEQ